MSARRDVAGGMISSSSYVQCLSTTTRYEYYDAGLDDFFANVGTPMEFQAALKAGVRHIVLTAHLDMRQSPSPPSIQGKESLNNVVGRVEDTTVSINIVVRIPPAAGTWCKQLRFIISCTCLRPCIHIIRTPILKLERSNAVLGRASNLLGYH